MKGISFQSFGHRDDLRIVHVCDRHSDPLFQLAQQRLQLLAISRSRDWSEGGCGEQDDANILRDLRANLLGSHAIIGWVAHERKVTSTGPYDPGRIGEVLTKQDVSILEGDRGGS